MMQSIPNAVRRLPAYVHVGTKQSYRLRKQLPLHQMIRHLSAAPAPSPTTDTSHHIHNRTLVQSRDYESFLIGLLHPSNIQPSYYSLRAFNVEIASIQAKESGVASMRMKWWSDAIQTLYSSSYDTESGTASGATGILSNPTVLGLNQAIHTHNLTQRFLERMVETRMGDLQKSNNSNSTGMAMFDSMNDMINFFERTNSTFLFLNLECCGVIDEEADKVANCIGVASGIVNMIRSIGCGHVGIPRDLIEKHGIQVSCINDPTEIVAGNDEEARIAVKNAVRQMAEIAGKYLSHARLHQGDVPKEGKCAMLPAVSALRYLDSLKNVDFDVFEEKIREVENTDSFNGRLWRFGHMMYLGRAHITGVF